MSFSKEQKTEIISQKIKASCCKSAFISGVLSVKGRATGKTVEISVEGESAASYVAALASDIYSKECRLGRAKNGGRRYTVTFESASAAKYLADISKSGELVREKCPLCQGAFLRGLFLACGRACDPRMQYSLEFSAGEGSRRIADYFTELGLSPKISVKPNETLVYFRRSGMIEDFFALAGMNNTAFAFMNQKINAELRNNVNRVTNCTTNNIDKAVSASMKQIALIEELVSKNLLSQLPEELEQTARLRLLHRDLSLSQLAALTTPRISKPGLSHRLKKITELAENLLDGK